MEKLEKFPYSFVNLLELFFVYIFISVSLTLLYVLAHVIIETIPFSERGNFSLPLKSIFASALMQLLSILILIYYVSRKQNRTWADILRFKSVKPILIASIIPLILGSGIIRSEISNLLNHIVTIPGYSSRDVLKLFGNPLNSFIFVVITAPIIEEILFRGIILEGFLSRYSPRKAILISAFIFSIVHLNPLHFFDIILVGIILGYLYTTTRSLIPCIIAHSLNNVLGWGSHYLTSDISAVVDNALEGPQFQPLWLDLFGILILMFGVWALIKTIDNPQGLNTNTQ